MKNQITPILIGLLIAGAITSATAQTPDQYAALESRIALLEKQNLSLKAAIEATTGKTLGEILVAASPAPIAAIVDEAATTAQPSGPTAGQIAAIAQVKARIAQIEAAKKARIPDPFADKPSVKTSKADTEKLLAIENRSLAELVAQLAAMEAAVR